MAQDLLEASMRTTGGDAVMVLSGEADLVSAGRLRALIDVPLSNGVRRLTVDASGLRYCDSAALRELLLAARTLRARAGDLVLLNPQPPVIRLLQLNAADQLLSIRADGVSAP
jgi:anti-sigma B factor antagonist